MKKKIFLLVILILALGATYLVSQKPQDIRTPAQTSDISTLTDQLLAQGSEIKSSQAATAGVKSHTQLKATASLRKEKLKELLKISPEEFLQSVLSPQDLQQIPQLLKDEHLVEEYVEKTGSLDIVTYDDFENKRATHEYVLDENNSESSERLTLYFADSTPSAAMNEIGVTGVKLDDQMAISEVQFSNPLEPDMERTTGNKKLAVIILNFLDNQSIPVTSLEVQAAFTQGDRSVNSFYQENSYGLLSFVPDTFGPFTTPFSINDDCYNNRAWTEDADAQAYAQGVQLDTYDHIMYVFPRKPNCNHAAWAEGAGTPARTWFSGWNKEFIISHELGHNLGLGHANFLSCGAKTIGTFSQHLNDCKDFEYGDWFDTMGTGYYHFNVAQKIGLGWIRPEQVVSLQQSGTYTLTPLEQNNDSAPKALKIPVAYQNNYYNYYVGYRQTTGLFDYPSDSEIEKGVQLHLGNHVTNTSTFLLDLHPEGSTYNHVNNASYFDNDRFEDIENGVTITQLSHNETSATIQVEQTCARQPLKVFSERTTVPGTPGIPTRFTLYIQNFDASLCPVATLNLALSYQNWPISISPGTSLEIKPGSFTQVEFIITPPPDAVNGSIHRLIISGTSQIDSFNFTYPFHVQLANDIQKVGIEPSQLTMSVGSAPRGLSALAYSVQNQPIWEGVTYDWGISSQDSVGTLTSVNNNLATFKPLNPGHGWLWVTARFGELSHTSAIQITVTGSAPSPSPRVTPTPSEVPLFVIADVIDSIKKYTTGQLARDYIRDTKINILDVGYVIKHLVF